MEITGRIVRQILLLSLLVLIAPMILFPDRLGMGLAGTSLINTVYELVYYVAVIFFFFRRASILKIAQMAGLCLVYRLALGTGFGLLIAPMYSLSLTVSLTLGLASYLPAILLHIAAAPFIIKPIAGQLVWEAKRRRLTVDEAPPFEVPEHDRGVVTVSTGQAISRPVSTHVPGPEDNLLRQSRFGDHPSGAEPDGGNGFDRAVKYIGEDGSVRLAVVVDDEGLLLGQFRRGKVEAEDWAPFSLFFCDANRAVLQRAGWGSPEKIDLLVRDTRIVVCRRESWTLMVIAQRHADASLSIRVNRGLEIIRKHIARRYGQKLPEKMENMYVSSAQ